MDDLDHITPSEALLSAIVAGTARFERFIGDEPASANGEVIINGIRHCVDLDAYGLPIQSSLLTRKLIADLAKRRARR